MPLKPGKQNFQSNIKEMIKSGRKPSQAVAAAYSKLRHTDKGFYGHLQGNQKGSAIYGGLNGDC